MDKELVKEKITVISGYGIFTKEEWEKRFSWTKQNI